MNAQLLEKLIEYGAAATLYSEDSLVAAVAAESPRFVSSEFVDSSLLALWPQMPRECRVLVVVLGEQVARGASAD